MGNELVETIKTGKEGEIIKIRPIGSIRDISLIPCILEVFTEYFKQGQYALVLDLSEIEYLTPALISLLFEVTAKARRNGGDVEIINLHGSLRQNILNFNPLDYLTVSETPEPEQEETPINSLETAPATIKPEGSWPDKGDSVPLSRQASEKIRIPSRAESIYKACDFVTSKAAKAGISSVEISKIKIAVYEACLNVIEHAYHSDPNQWITVSVEHDQGKFNIMLVDNGEAFKDAKTGSYDVIEAASKRKTGGMGLHIIQQSMDKVNYSSDPLIGNLLTMVKNIGTTASAKIPQDM